MTYLHTFSDLSRILTDIRRRLNQLEAQQAAIGKPYFWLGIEAEGL